MLAPHPAGGKEVQWHGVLLLLHRFDRDGEARRHNTAHVVELRGGRISRWEERPGSQSEFERAWGAP
jgi:hypothetical protein